MREWCTNVAWVHPATLSVIADSEDGSIYRRDLATDTLTESVSLTAGIGEAYTPTLVAGEGSGPENRRARQGLGGSIPSPSACWIDCAGGRAAMAPDCR